MTREEAQVKNFDILHFVADNAGLSTFETIEKAYNMGVSEQKAVLDKIRAEIEALIEWHDCPIEYDNGNDAWYCEACNQAIKIIDKYKAESENKEW